MEALTITEEVSARGIANLTLTRPEKGNALDHNTLAQLADALQRIERDAHIRVLVLRGAGKHFCSGADVSADIKSRGETSDASLSQVCARLDAFPKPTIAVVHGACIGGGLALAASCDLVFATPDAIFAIPEVRLGFPPVELMPIFLAACGPRFLRRYLLTGSRFAAADALACGMVHAVYDPAAIEAAVAEATEACLQAAPNALAAAKALLARLLREDVPSGELHALHESFVGGEEAREGLASFKEKRRPRWFPPDHG